MLFFRLFIARRTRLRFAVKTSACLCALGMFAPPPYKKSAIACMALLFHSELLDFKRFRGTATAQRRLLDRDGDAVRRVEIGEHIVDVQHAAVDAL